MKYPTIIIAIMVLAGCGGSRDASTGDADRAAMGGGAARNATVLNSAADEFAPVLAADGRSCLVTSTRGHEAGMRVISPEFARGEAIYAVTRSGDAATGDAAASTGATQAPWLLALDEAARWSAATSAAPGRFDQVNTGAPVIDADAGRVYFSGTYRAEGDGGADIWSLPWPVPPESDPIAFPEQQPRNESALNSPWWDAQPALSADGETIVFASDRVEATPSARDTGRRAPQLWIARRTGEGWSAPALLPAPVNSGTSEMSPHFGADGWLYFATKRWPDAGWEIARARMSDADGGWSVPERLGAPYNSPEDDVFPFLSADRMQLLFASNRPGGKGGYDIWFAEMAYCVPLDVLVQLRDSDGAAAKPGAGILLEVIESATGRVVLRETTGDDGHLRAQCLRVGTDYIVRPTAKSCYLDAADVPFTTPMPADLGDGVTLAIDLRRLELPEFHVVSDSIPFFVTGYWYPNTTAELKRLRERREAGELPTANFIDLGDYDYDAAARRVDQWFDNLYASIDRMLVPMLDSCYGAADTLVLFVQGYVDPRGLSWGKFDETQEVRTLRAVVRPGTVMSGQDGNVKLSHLRASYAMEMIDRAMEKYSDRYRFLRAQRRIRYQCDGGYIGASESGEVNDPLKRKFTVTVEVKRRVGG